METSDSENFESADEDYQSDAEPTPPTKNPPQKQKPNDDDHVQNTTTQLKTLKIDKAPTIKDHKPQNEPAKTINSPTNSETNKRPVETENENLWDDEELDWGREAQQPHVSVQPKEEANLWSENEDWETVEKQPEAVTAPQADTWSAWGTWGSSLLTSGVATLTHGLSSALETGIGVPDPAELARINRSEAGQRPAAEAGEGGFGLGNFVQGVSHLTKLVESTGTKVISGGLDTLETIGKKTMEVLQDGDPGLKKKRAFLQLQPDKPVLSQLLREAKEKSEVVGRIETRAKRVNYESVFDDYQGLVHLEALEMLSKQCDIKLETLLESYENESLQDMQETMEQVKELCELPDEDEDEQLTFGQIKEKLEAAVGEIGIGIRYDKLTSSWEETEEWLKTVKMEVCTEVELHQQAIETLAQLTAIAVEQFHKTAELLLVKEHRSTADEADSLVQLTASLISLIGIVAAKFSDKLNVKSKSDDCKKDEINGLITNVFYEAGNSSSYIQDAFQLLIPILQVGAV